MKWRKLEMPKKLAGTIKDENGIVNMRDITLRGGEDEKQVYSFVSDYAVGTRVNQLCNYAQFSGIGGLTWWRLL